MNILYLAHRLPYPPNKGEKIRTFHQIQQLAKKHTIHLCAFVDDLDDLRHATALKKYCASVEVVYRGRSAGACSRAALGILRGLPLSVSLFYRTALAKKVRQKLSTERFDCVIGSSSSMAQYAALANGLPKVIDFIDVDSEKWSVYAQRHAFPMSFIYRLEGLRLAKYERTITEAFDLSILISEAERYVLQERVPGGSISVISNGVDFEYFKPSEISDAWDSLPSIIFTGVMDYFPNVDAVQYFCHKIFPLVRDRVAEAQFWIVGRNPLRAVTELAKQPNVVVTGAVADVRPYLARASVSVVPFRLARGVQNKILESMAMGIPVVGTTEAFKGISAMEQDGVRIADDPHSFARQVATFLQGDASLRQEAGFQARRYVERHHRWDEQGAQLEELLEMVVSGGRIMKERTHHEVPNAATPQPNSTQTFHDEGREACPEQRRREHEVRD